MKGINKVTIGILLSIIVISAILINNYVHCDNKIIVIEKECNDLVTNTCELTTSEKAVLKSCLQSKVSPLENTIESMTHCNFGTTCTVNFQNDIYLRQIPSGSNCPHNFVGDYVVYMKVSATEKLKIGDIVNYRRGFSDVGHRIIGFCNGGYVVKGDFNNVDDGCILFSEIVGVEVMTIRGVGK